MLWDEEALAIILKGAARIFKMNEYTFDEIERARKLLDLGEDATLRDIKRPTEGKQKVSF